MSLQIGRLCYGIPTLAQFEEMGNTLKDKDKKSKPENMIKSMMIVERVSIPPKFNLHLFDETTER